LRFSEFRLKIKSVESFMLSIPMKPENLSFGKVDRVDYNIVRVDAGKFVGFGEAATLLGPRWSEESKETIDVIVRHYLSKIVVGKDTSKYRKISSTMDANVQGNPFAKAAVEMAVLDAYGKECEEPVYSILEKKYRDSVPLSWTIANNDPDLDAEEARSLMKKGWRILKIKVGSLPLKKDLDRIREVRKAVGDEISLRIDLNQGWKMEQALSALKPLKKEHVALIEQPLPKWDTEGAAQLVGKSPIPIMADEALCSVHDATELIGKKAAGAFAYKLTKMGGMTNSRHIYSLARRYRISSYIGCMIETSIGTAGYLQFAASIPELTYGCELFGPLRIKDDLVSHKIEYDKGKVKIPSGVGLGVDVDENKLGKLKEPN
jgi:muconate cycloisomerase